MKPAFVIIGALVALGLGALVLGVPGRTERPQVHPTDPSTTAPVGLSTEAQTPAGAKLCLFGAGWKGSFVWDGRVESRTTIAGQPVGGEKAFGGKLALEAVKRTADGEWVVVGQFSALRDEVLKEHGADFAAPFLLKFGESCELKAFARLGRVAKKTAKAQQSSLHDFWVFAPDTDGSVAVTFPNGTGLAAAQVTRRRDEVTRAIQRYEVAWGTKANVAVTGSFATASVGEGWLTRFESVESIAGGVVNGATLTVRLQREAEPSAVVEKTASRAEADYVWENLLPQAVSNAAGVAGVVPTGERPFVEAMKNTTLDVAFESLAQKAEAKANIEDQWHEMAGFLNAHPEQVAEFAKGLRQPDFPEAVKGVAFLALSKTVHPQAREALTSIREDETAPRLDRVRASLALVTRADVGRELADQLKTTALEKGGDPTNALLHLGVLASMHRADTDTQEIANQAVEQALAGAGENLASLSVAFGALGNLASERQLPTIAAYTRSSNVEVRVLAPRALRGYPYAVTEPLVLEWLARETSPDVKQEIFNVVYHQLADAQRNASRELVQEAIKHLTLQPRALARQSIIQLVGPTHDEFPESPAALMAQLPIEFRNRSGLFDLVATYLTPEEMTATLSKMPEFEHQFGPAGHSPAALNAFPMPQPQPVGARPGVTP